MLNAPCPLCDALARRNQVRGVHLVYIFDCPNCREYGIHCQLPDREPDMFPHPKLAAFARARFEAGKPICLIPTGLGDHSRVLDGRETLTISEALSEFRRLSFDDVQTRS